MYVPKHPNDSLVLSYLALRKAIGFIGLALPFALIFGRFALQGVAIEPSISDYYYSAMGDVFVGSLCAIGVFLLTYRGLERRDDIAGNLACVFAIGVAVFPTAQSETPVGVERLVGMAHYISAALMFMILAYFCLVLFVKTDPNKPMTPEKQMRNRVYRGCGGVILACIAAIGIVKLALPPALIAPYDPVFWLESIAVVAFGFSWLVKGETILKDD